MYKLWISRDLAILHDGPAGTGKTRGVCERDYQLCKKYPGCRILWLRKRRVDLNESVLTTFESLVVPEGSELLSGPTKEHRTKYTFDNGSEILLRGLDDPERTRSLEVDHIRMFEATEFTEDDFDTLPRALRWGMIPYSQIILETNPGPPQHWILDRVAAGGIVRLPSTHKDNPRLWDSDAGEWTEFGAQYVNTTLDMMRGTKRKRLKDGLWVADENAAFDLEVLAEHRRRFAEEPYHVGDLEMPFEGSERDQHLADGNIRSVEWKPGDNGHWKLWCDLYPVPGTKQLRPDQNILPVLFADVSWGQEASNSVICVGDKLTRRKIAEFACATMPPEQFARIIVMAGHWFGGRNRCAFVGWERNGPGKTLANILGRVIGYPWMYSETSYDRGSKETARKAKLGWWSDQQKKLDLLMQLRESYAAGTLVNPSRSSLDEAMTYIRYPTGEVGPARLVEESREAKATHGDRVIADMGMVHMMNVAAGFSVKGSPPPRGSVAERLGIGMEDAEEFDDDV